MIFPLRGAGRRGCRGAGDVRVSRVAAGVVGTDAVLAGRRFAQAGVDETVCAWAEIGDFVEKHAVGGTLDLESGLVSGFVRPCETDATRLGRGRRELDWGEWRW